MLLIGIGLVVIIRDQNEPTYDGHDASYWLEHPNPLSVSPFPDTFGFPGSSFGDVDAFEAMSTNAWNFLAAATHREESWYLSRYRRVYSKWLWRWQQHLPDPGPPWEEVRIRAMEIMFELQPTPTNLVATLYSLLNDPNRNVSDLALRHLLRARFLHAALMDEIRQHPLETLPRETAFRICNGLKPDFKIVRPFIERVLAVADPAVREDGLVAAQGCAPDAKVLKSYAADALRDPDNNVRYRAVYILLDLGTNAVDVLPELRKLLNDDSVIVRNASLKAIRVIGGVDEASDGVASSHGR